MTISNNIKSSLKKFFLYEPNNTYEFELPDTNIDQFEQLNDEIPQIVPDNQKIYKNIDANLEYIRIKYNSIINNDISIREFNLFIQNKSYKAFLLYIDGMINITDVNNFILKPLMHYSKFPYASESYTSEKLPHQKLYLSNYIMNILIPQTNIKKVKNFSDLISDINSGNTALFVDNLSTAFSIELKGFEHRTISKPENEIIVQGSQEAFVENIRTNTSLLRRIINSQDLIIEQASVGKITKTKIAIAYMKNIAHNDLISEVKYRINNLNVDYVLSAGQLEKLIQDNPNSVFPQIVLTERPDKASNALLEGKVIVLVNGVPYSLIMPSILMDFLSSPEDINLKYQYTTLLRFIRLVAFAITLLLPGLYVAITAFHNELIPTELLFAMAAARESVPFPIIVELIIMEFSFELIREAGLRVPSPIGPTIGIVGALILGEAAVSANIVSPILIIIVAITAICSFAIPDYSMGFTLRIYRFMYIILGYLCGFLGIALGIFFHIIFLSSLKSFGVPYLASHVFINKDNKNPKYFPRPIYKEEKRANFLNTKRPYKQAHISRKWEN